MINHSLKENIISLSIAQKDFSYRIPTKKIGNTIDWRIGAKNTEGIVIKGVSTWTLQLFTKAVTEAKYVQQFKDIVGEYSPSNTINWDETQTAVNIQNEYNKLVAAQVTALKKMSEQEIILSLKKKFNLD